MTTVLDRALDLVHGRHTNDRQEREDVEVEHENDDSNSNSEISGRDAESSSRASSLPMS